MRLLCVALACVVQLGCAARMSYSTTPGGDRRLCLPRECYRLGPLDVGWQPVQQSAGELGFYDRELGGVIQANAVCRDDVEAVPLGNLTDHLLVGYTSRHVREATIVPLAGREALRTVVEVALDGVPMVLDLYVLKRNGCLFDLSYAAPPAAYPRGVADFQRFVAGFTPLAPVTS